MNRHGISFCNTCADMFLMEVSITLKKCVEISTYESKVRQENNSTHTTITKKYLLHSQAIGLSERKYKSYFVFIHI